MNKTWYDFGHGPVFFDEDEIVVLENKLHELHAKGVILPNDYKQTLWKLRHKDQFEIVEPNEEQEDPIDAYDRAMRGI